MIRLNFSQQHQLSGKASAAARWGGEFAQEDWNVDPLWLMSVPDFLAHLVSLYGPQYLERVDYQRDETGRLVPVG